MSANYISVCVTPLKCHGNPDLPFYV